MKNIKYFDKNIENGFNKLHKIKPKNEHLTDD